MDFLPADDLTFIFLSNLRSVANRQIRAQVQNILRGRAVATVASTPAVGPVFESPSAVIGAYGDPADPVVISEAEGRLFCDGNEFYPIAGRWYYLPASGSRMRFGRDSSGNVESIVTALGNAPERVLRRIRSR